MGKISKCFSFLQIVLCSLVKRKTKFQDKDENKRILVIMDQLGVGDAVCSLDAFYNIAWYTKDKYELYIATTPSVVHFLKESQSTFDAQLITLELRREIKFYYNVFKENQQKLDTCHWDYIISLNRIGNYMKLLLMNCSYDKMLGMEFIEQKISPMEKFFQKQLKNFHCIYLHDITHIMQVYAMIALQSLHVLADENKNNEYLFYQIPYLGKNPLINKKGNYCIICPSIATQQDHPFAHRKWPLERFMSIINFILDSSDLFVCLCGVEADRADNEYVISHIKKSPRIIDMTGKTSFKEWIELIRGAKFVFGNDSGYIHLAAYLGVQSFAIAGYWNYGRFLPYRGEYIKSVVKPIDIRMPMVSCTYCAHRDTKDITKQQCNHLVKEEGVYKCVWDISVEQAVQTLESSGVLDK